MNTSTHAAQAGQDFTCNREIATHPEQIDISCYENEIPAFAAAEVDRLHGHLYCSLSYLEMTGQLDGASTYVVRKNGVPATVLLYKREGDTIVVISEFVQLAADEVRRFAEHMFSTSRSVNMLSFSRIRGDFSGLTYPRQEMAYTEDMIVALPPTVKDYEARVGKNMRRNIKRYTNSLERDFPSYTFSIYEDQGVEEQDIRDLIRLSCLRMESKNIVPRFNEAETRWIVELARQRGLVGIARIEGRVCGGAIGFRIGENYFMHVIAHDPRYNDYSLGILCYYHTICEGIARGGKLFHLLQGRYGYKYRLLAERHDVLQLDIYRNRMWMLLHGRRVARKSIDGHVLAIKQWLLHDVERSKHPALRFLGNAVNTLRRRKRSSGSTHSSEVAD